MSGPGLTFLTSDQKDVHVSIEIARHFLKFQSEVNNLGMGAGVGGPIVMGDISSAIFLKVIEWTKHHKDDPPSAVEVDETVVLPSDDIGPWDLEFLKVDDGTLFQLVVAAEFLDIQGWWT